MATGYLLTIVRILSTATTRRKMPCFLSLSLSFLLFIGCKITHFLSTAKLFVDFFAFFLSFYAFSAFFFVFAEAPCL